MTLFLNQAVRMPMPISSFDHHLLTAQARCPYQRKPCYYLQLSPITAAQIKAWTDHDPILSQVRDLVMKGWTTTTNPELSPYQQCKDKLSAHDGCLLWGSRVIVPPPGHDKVMADLHERHPGICRMKQLA